MTDVCVEMSVVAVTAPEPRLVEFSHHGEQFTAEMRVGALRTGTVFFVSLRGVLLVRAVWDLGHERAVNATLAPAGAAAFTLDEANALVVAAEEAMAEALTEAGERE